MAVNQLSLKFTDHNFRISFFHRNSEGTVDLQIVLFTRNSLSVGSLRVCVIVILPEIFCPMDGRH